MYTKYEVSMSSPVPLGMMPTHLHTQKSGTELRACNRQPSEPFISGG